MPICQYATTNDKSLGELHFNFDLRHCKIWPKKSGKGHQEWTKAWQGFGRASPKVVCVERDDVPTSPVVQMFHFALLLLKACVL